MTSQLVLNEPMIDWYTITTYDENAARKWWSMASAKGSDEKKIMQYEGRQITSVDGSVFVGSGYQKKGLHHMIRVGGALADENRGVLFEQLKQGTIRVTRLDVQCTIKEPEGWSQWKLFNRVKRSGKKPGWAESEDRDCGTLETVYIGSRTSNRFSRVYVKPSAGGVRLLRLETEYKRDRAHASARAMIGDNGFRPGQLLRHELDNSIADDKLHAIFGHWMGDRPSASVKVRVSTDDDKTMRWLMEDVFPAWKRMAYNHDHGQELVTMYGDEIQRWVDSGGWENE